MYSIINVKVKKTLTQRHKKKNNLNKINRDYLKKYIFKLYIRFKHKIIRKIN